MRLAVQPLSAPGKMCPETRIKKLPAENQCLSSYQYKRCPLFSATPYLEQANPHDTGTSTVHDMIQAG